MTGDLKQLLTEVGVLVESAAVCGEAVSASGIVESQDFNQLMIFLMDAGALCAQAQQSPQAADPDIVFPRFKYPARVSYPPPSDSPSVIYPRSEAVREVLISEGVEGLYDVVIDPAGRAKLLPFKGS